MLKKYTLLFFGSLVFLFAVHAQPINQEDTLNKKRLSAVVISGSTFYLAGNAFLQYVWYKGYERADPFLFYNDNRGWLQMDKLGHMYSAYHESYIGYRTLRWAGVDKKKSLIYGGLLGFVLQAPIEVFDGLYEGYGFSPGDIVANATGSGLFMLQQGLFNEQIVKLKFSYSPSPYAKYHPFYLGENQVESFFMDYNGHTYWLSLNLKSVFHKSKLPAWLNVAAGYSGNGMLAEFKNPSYYRRTPIPSMERYRQFLFSLDVDLSKIKTKNKFLKAVLNCVNAIKIPAPALEYNRIDHFKFRYVYF